MSGPDRNRSGQLRGWAAAAEHMGTAYLRYAHTRSTNREVELLIEQLRLEAGMRVVDVGCGPGRHAQVLRGAGIGVVGVDAAPVFAALAGPPAVVADAHVLPLPAGAFDAAYAIQLGEADELVLTELARVLRPGGRLLVTAFNTHFARRHAGLPPDAERNVEHTTIRDAHGREAPFELSYRCVTPPALRGLAREAGIEVEATWSVEPGRYGPHALSDDLPELLLVGRKPRL